MIEPDDREQIYYDLMAVLRADAETQPHYWTNLINTFKMLEDGEIIAICDECWSLSVTEIKTGHYICDTNIESKYQPDKKGRIVLTQEIKEDKKHKIIFMSQTRMVDRMLDNIIDLLREPSGYSMSLFQIENYLFAADMDSFFETVRGEVSKSRVTEELTKISDFITERIVQLRPKIRFSNAPPIRR